MDSLSAFKSPSFFGTIGKNAGLLNELTFLSSVTDVSFLERRVTVKGSSSLFYISLNNVTRSAESIKHLFSRRQILIVELKFRFVQILVLRTYHFELN